ncbi:unnamed protein product [Ectocarpus sp. 12 AP-2014]
MTSEKNDKGEYIIGDDLAHLLREMTMETKKPAVLAGLVLVNAAFTKRL